jgi:hypothetical protein
VVESNSAVDCSESRFWRTEAERTIPDMCETFLVLPPPFYRVSFKLALMPI